METVSVPLSAYGYSGKGSVSIHYESDYDIETNRTTIKFSSASFFAGSIEGNIELAQATISVRAADNEKSTATAIISTTGTSIDLVAVPRPAAITVQHEYNEVEKSVVISVFATLRLSNGANADGKKTETVKTGIASIVRVGENIGTLYAFVNGAWRVGILYAASGGKWNGGVGYIFLEPEVYTE